MDFLSTCGDYEYEVMILKTIFDMCSHTQIRKRSRELFPEAECLENAFVEIGDADFDLGAVRRFLNLLNNKSQKVFSVKCLSVYLDDRVQPLPSVSVLRIYFIV